MLKYADKSDVQQLLDFIDNGAFGTKAKSIIDSYGTDSGLVDVWYEKNSTAVVRFDGAVTLYCTDKTDYDEVRQLISVVGAGAVFGEYNSVMSIYGKCDRYGSVVSIDSVPDFYESENAADRLSEIYSLISNNIPDSFAKDGYMYWLSDIMHRMNKNSVHIRCIIKDGKAAASALTSAETEYAAVISGVACDKSCRGSGYGKAVVLSLAALLKQMNKRIYLFVLNENALSFYEKIGFYEIGKWAEIRL